MESSNRPSVTISSATKHKKDKESEIANAIHELKTSWKDSELSKKKMVLLQEQCRAAEQFFWQQDYVFKQQEEAHKAREHVFHEWERLQLNMRELGQALDTLNNPLLKCDMGADLVVLIDKKNKLASMLNLTQ